MRSILLAATAVAVLSVAACSQEQRADIKDGADSAASEVRDAASDIKNDPDVRDAGNAIEEAARDSGQALKETAAEAGDALEDAAADAKREGKELGSDLKRETNEAAGDVKRATDGKEETKPR
ncbi:cell surface protein [Caulobacter sp. NIBR2454]|uniref:cell surface protein n=1 Tax=Caulobacter sp. NIBR2454 TaxID=3015996 RepID=UPI0022B72D20|nr:cell surface protein [Caulobacter sp. NIBR2454]